ncbi:MAG: hypothetical protein ACTSQE_12270 [Candidatus Heimdallarchaeaceae archaeon]
MKKNALIILLATIMIGTSFPFQPVNSYDTELAIGDSILYRKYQSSMLNEFRLLGAYDPNTDINEYMSNSTTISNATIYKSYTVVGFEDDYVVTNATERYESTYEYSFEETWAPLEDFYGIAFKFIGNTTEESYPDSVYSYNTLDYILMSNLSMFDFVYFTYQEVIYVESYYQEYVINGQKQNLLVDEYYIYARQSNVYDEQYYDTIEYQLFCSTVWWATIYMWQNDDWTPIDDEFGYKNDTLCLSFYYYDPGEYSFLIELYDYDGNVASIFTDVVYDPIDEDEDPPTIEGPMGSLEIIKGEQDELIWSLTDSHPLEIQIYVNNSLIQEISWDETDATVTFDISSFDVGTYNITIVAFDVNQNRASISIELAIKESPEDTTDITDDNTGTLKAGIPVSLTTLPMLALIVLLKQKRRKKYQ